ncbi:MAG: DUF6786 family protein [Candidatus Brocadiia bacterium]
MSRRAGVLWLAALAGCAGLPGAKQAPTFRDDLAFLDKHTDAFVLSDEAGEAHVVVVPQYQGRVMTSTAGGPEGLSFGWINRELIASGRRLEQMNPFGGEDRMWLGPEGGQFSIFFPQGASREFKFEDWQTPEAIDWGPWELVERSPTHARFRKKMTLTNFSGTTFDLMADRTVRLLGPADVEKHFGLRLPEEVDAVAFESDNRITNTGKKAWTKDKGLLSIWILCMFTPSPSTTVVIPYVEGPEAKLGPVVNDAYFGEIPPDRLKIEEGVIYFKCDGKKRGKLGLSPQRAKPIMGSYDAAHQVLTLATYTKPQGTTDYVNSMWEIQEHPYGGDVVNSYNDGPTPAGPPLGPFYELESSSPAAALEPGETLRHVHRTLHVTGPANALDPLARQALGVSIAEIKSAFQ